MASSKGSPGPHDRKNPDEPRPKCSKIAASTGKRCKRDAIGRTRLCKSHFEQAQAEQARLNEQKTVDLDQNARQDDENYQKRRQTTLDRAQPTVQGIQKGGMTTKVRKEGQKLIQQAESTALQTRKPSTPSPGSFVINEQAKVALQKLGKPVGSAADPRQTLLDTVASAWRQQQVWEQMLASVPDEDWEFVGVTPVPGSQHSAKGARIEAIQKFLSEATKVAARTSKLAIDAGIEERLVRLAEEQSAMIADTVKAGVVAAVRVLVSSLHLSPEQESQLLNDALGSAAQQLRLLAAGVPAEQSTVVEGTATEVHRTFDDYKPTETQQRSTT